MDISSINGTDDGRATDGNMERRAHAPWIVAILSFIDLLRAVAAFLRDIFGTRRKKRAARVWHLKVRAPGHSGRLSREEIDRLMRTHQSLNDADRIAKLSASFRAPESDFFGDPTLVERLIRRILEENPPWLHVSRVLAGADSGGVERETENLWREQEVREIQDVTLFVPDESWRDKPLSSLTLRPAKHIGEVWQGRLLDQILPPTILIDRCNRGEIMVPVRNSRHQRLEFRPEQRRLEVVVRKPVPIPIEIHDGAGTGGQLLYILLDYSASMRGGSATKAMAVIAAALRANMGQRSARYLFRRYAEEIWPPIMELPVQARTLAEKDSLLTTILATNFNGAATHVNDALDIAITDIQNLRREESLEAAILLITDGRAEILDSTANSIRRANVQIHTVMVTPDKNPGLDAISASYTALDIPTESRTQSSRAA